MQPAPVRRLVKIMRACRHDRENRSAAAGAQRAR